MQEVLVKNTLFDGKMQLDPTDLIQHNILKNGDWEEYHNPIYQSYINRGDICLDIGAHIGMCSLKMASLGARVHSFECDRNTYPVLCKNIINNGLVDITPYNIAVGDRSQITKYLWYYPNNKGGSGLEISDIRDTEGVKMRMPRFGNPKPYNIFVDAIDNMDFGGKVKFIKTDTEGCDYKVLLGGRKTIMRDRPVIIYEAEPEVQEKIRSLLHTWYYDVQKLSKTDFLALSTN